MQLTDKSCSLAGIFLGKSEAFETEFAAYCKTQYCVGVGNGLESASNSAGYGDWSGG